MRQNGNERYDKTVATNYFQVFLGDQQKKYFKFYHKFICDHQRYFYKIKTATVFYEKSYGISTLKFN